MNETEQIIDPAYQRQTIIGHRDVERKLRLNLDNGQLSHGWIIGGAKGIGKATLAMRLARAKLAPAGRIDVQTLATDPEDSDVRKVTNLAHPDFFLVRREWDEKKGKYNTDIPVDQVRAVTHKLNLTASGKHGRVAIIDSADDMNINAANALLKILEEPPSNTLILLLTDAPGRLLATLRSRCRRVMLRPVPDNEIDAMLQAETHCTDKERKAIVAAARGRPGYALALAQEGGAKALIAADQFVKRAMAGQPVMQIAGQFTHKDNSALWEIFRDNVLSTLSDQARLTASHPGDGHSNDDPLVWLSGWETLSHLCARGERLNLDRGSLIEAMAFDLAQISRKANQ